MASGELAFGLTDTDDALEEMAAGMPVAIVYPDQAEGEFGTLFIPNTLALVNGLGASRGGGETAELAAVERRGERVG